MVRKDRLFSTQLIRASESPEPRCEGPGCAQAGVVQAEHQVQTDHPAVDFRTAANRWELRLRFSQVWHGTGFRVEHTSQQLPTNSPQKRPEHQIEGDIGGRHCLMLLEHDAAIDFFISPLDHKEGLRRLEDFAS